jgi:hypothetical protein
MRRLALLFLFLVPLTAMAGEQPAAGMGELPFSVIRGARLPKAGEWLEYVIAFPVDPLEKSMRDFFQPADVPGTAADTPEPPPVPAENMPLSQIYLIDREPVFEAPRDWYSMRLRLEITGVDQDGCHAVMRYENRQDVVAIPLDVDPAGGKSVIDETEEEPHIDEGVRGDAPVDPSQLDELFSGIGEEERPEASVREFSSHWVGNRSISVEIERGGDMLAEYVRLSSRDVPFGVVRFATADIDFVLVDYGVGIAPDFPLPEIHIEPDVGKLL